MRKTYGDQLRSYIEREIGAVATIEIREDDAGHHGNRVIVIVSRSGSAPIMMARQHPVISGLSATTLGSYFVADYEGLVGR